MKINGISQGYIGILLFVLLSGTAMVFYPGGTLHDNNTIGYQFFYNYFSNLGEWTARNGEPNSLSAYLFNSALIILAVSYFTFYYNFLKKLSLKLNNKFFSFSLIITVVISMLSFVFVAVFSGEPSTHDLHVFFVKLAFRTMFVHCVFQVLAMFRINEISMVVRFISIFFSLALLGYILIMDFGPKAGESNQALFIQVIAQKVVVGSILIYYFFQLTAAKILTNTKSINHE